MKNIKVGDQLLCKKTKKFFYIKHKKYTITSITNNFLNIESELPKLSYDDDKYESFYFLFDQNDSAYKFNYWKDWYSWNIFYTPKEHLKIIRKQKLQKITKTNNIFYKLKKFIRLKKIS